MSLKRGRQGMPPGFIAVGGLVLSFARPTAWNLTGAYQCRSHWLMLGFESVFYFSLFSVYFNQLANLT